ncbi:1-acyl-sn-glycerol-3-phosphate acyltransferase [Humitalea rosea]|uniref:1-acyl-sn-glycerol-3-phosphate acyltransferase n=1 Tax=Humitalea rosea TaxID=990373 RepID=A0A2W7HYG6_9PROT|nr:lysophospholipid acyltransferase family protein [Humitalea rosea]PZW37718.1 1-acyl-sn-glycerol-3-phosphate acyltransferase [Humitalea rosea]
MLIWVRSAMFNLAFFVMTGGLILIGLPYRFGRKESTLRVMSLWARGVIWLMGAICGIRLRVTGVEHIPKDGPCLIACNHQSAFDTIVWLMLLPRPIYVIKAELLKIPGYGGMAKQAGSIPVDRAAGASAMRGLLRAGQARAAEGGQIVIFPEGTRAPPGAALPWQPGVVALAGTVSPVIPAATDSGQLWGRRAFRKLPGTITLSILPPLPKGLPRVETVRLLEARVREEATRLEALAEVR